MNPSCKARRMRKGPSSKIQTIAPRKCVIIYKENVKISFSVVGFMSPFIIFHCSASNCRLLLALLFVGSVLTGLYKQSYNLDSKLCMLIELC